MGIGRSDLFLVGAFTRHNLGLAYLTEVLAYGGQDTTTDRSATAGVDRLRAESKADAWPARIEEGYRFVAQGFGWTPYAAGQFITFDLPVYAEQAILGSNQLALAYDSKSVITDTGSELGLRTDKPFAMTRAVLTLRDRGAWAHNFNPDRGIAAPFQTLPASSFVVDGAAMASDAALVTGSAEMKLINGWSDAATFEGEFFNNTRSYAGKGVVRYAW